MPSDDEISRLHLLGVFATYAAHDKAGTLGATVHLNGPDDQLCHHELINGRHYVDAAALDHRQTSFGDGSSVATVGSTKVDGQACRVDLLSIDVEPPPGSTSLCFKDLGGASSFLIFDLFYEVRPKPRCPFSSRGGGVPLSEMGMVLRMRDYGRFCQALEQLEQSLEETSDLDEARGQGLTFLAVVTSAMLEQGGSRSLHNQQLEAARELERLGSQAEFADAIRRRAEEVSSPLFGEQCGPSGFLVQRALKIVDRHYAKNLTDTGMAEELGLSTSHFRYLFRQATGQPFHRYLMALRLEKARRLLVEEAMPVSTVARAVGFTGLSHFSKAFSQRFGVSPTSARRVVP